MVGSDEWFSSQKTSGFEAFIWTNPSIHPWISNHQTSLLSGANFVSFRWLSRWSTFLDLRSWDEKTWPRWCRFSFFWKEKSSMLMSFKFSRYTYIYIFILYNFYIFFWDSHIIHILRCRSQFDWNRSVFVLPITTSTWRGISRRQGRSTPAFYLWWSSFPKWAMNARKTWL